MPGAFGGAAARPTPFGHTQPLKAFPDARPSGPKVFFAPSCRPPYTLLRRRPVLPRQTTGIPMRTTCLRCVMILVLGAAVPLAAPGQPPVKPKPGDEMIEKYLAAETDRLSQKVLDGATTLAEWQQRRPRLRQEYLYMLGLWPLPEKTPLKVTVTGTLQRD